MQAGPVFCHAAQGPIPLAIPFVGACPPTECHSQQSDGVAGDVLDLSQVCVSLSFGSDVAVSVFVRSSWLGVPVGVFVSSSWSLSSDYPMCPQYSDRTTKLR